MRTFMTKISSFFSRRNAYYRATRVEAMERNVKNLSVISTSALMMLGFCCLLTPQVIKGWEISIYHILFFPALIICAAVSWIYSRFRRKNYWISVFMCLAFNLVVLAFSIAIDIFPNSESPASFIPMMYIVLPTLFIIPQPYMYAMMVVCEVVYTVLAYEYKVDEIAQFDVFNSMVGLLFSAMIIQIILNLRLKDYTLMMEYQDLSTRDQLSGMLNKESFKKAVDEYLICKGGRYAHAMCIIDMDDFKKINDTYGHNVGDKLLQLEGRILKETFRATDILGRFGGDEYIVFVKDMADPKVIAEKSELIQQKLMSQAKEELSLEASCSIGFVLAGKGQHDYETLLECADSALYQAKKSGKKSFRMMKYTEYL